MSTYTQVRQILLDTLQLSPHTDRLQSETRLLDEIPEFDSMAVVNVVTALEDQFDITFEDEELTADIFVSVGTLVAYVESKMAS